jgi:hypothetical protein
MADGRNAVGATMDEVDLTVELMEREAELDRRARANALLAPQQFSHCRDCEEPLVDRSLRATGFCDRYCRDRFELAEKLRRINGHRH